MAYAAVVLLLLLAITLNGTYAIRLVAEWGSIMKEVNTGHPETIRVPTGADVTLKCRGSGVKPATHFLYQGTANINNQLSTSMSSLIHIIRNVNYWNHSNMVYGCADRSAITVVKLTLVVLMPPTIYSGPRLYVKLGVSGKQILECFAYGNPQPYVSFKREGQTLQSASFATVKDATIAGKQIPLVQNSVEVVINSTDDYGNYTCIANNSQGNETRNSLVEPLEFPRILSITRLPMPVAVGFRFTLSCVARGIPIPTMVWLLPNGLSHLSHNVTKDGHNVSSQLIVRSSQYEDAGKYECIAMTGKYFEDSTQTVVNVTGIPEPPTNITIANVTSTSCLITFILGFDGMSSILYSIVELRDIQSSNVTKVKVFGTNSFVLLDHLTPYSEYSIRMYSVNGNSESRHSQTVTFTTDIAIPDEVPSGLKVLVMNSTSVCVQWKNIAEANWNSPVIGFVVQYESRYYWISETDETAVNLTVVISDLTPYTWYNFSVAAFNSRGRGNYSGQVRVRSSEDVPSSPPRRVWTSGNTSRSVVVHFEAPLPEALNGVLLGFILIVQDVEEDIIVYNTTVNYMKLSANIVGLEPYTRYSIGVAAFNRVGHGPWSSLSFSTAEEKSGPPTLLQVNSGIYTATLEWKVPTSPNGNVAKYLISYTKDGNMMNSSTFEYVDAVTTRPIQQHTVHNLSSGANYTFIVYAINGMGLGEPSRHSHVTVASVVSQASLLTDGTTTGLFVSGASPSTTTGASSGIVPTLQSSGGISESTTVIITSCAIVGGLLVILIPVIYCVRKKQLQLRTGKREMNFVATNASALHSDQPERYSKAIFPMTDVNPEVKKKGERLQVIENYERRVSDIEHQHRLEEDSVFRENETPTPARPPMPDRKPSKAEIEDVKRSSGQRASSPCSDSSVPSEEDIPEEFLYSQPAHTVPCSKKTSRKVKHDPSVDNTKMAESTENLLRVSNMPLSLKGKPFDDRDYSEPQDTYNTIRKPAFVNEPDDETSNEYEVVEIRRKTAKKKSLMERILGKKQKSRSKSSSEIETCNPTTKKSQSTMNTLSDMPDKSRTLPSRKRMTSGDNDHLYELPERSLSLSSASGGNPAHTAEGNMKASEQTYQELERSKSRELREKGHEYAHLNTPPRQISQSQTTGDEYSDPQDSIGESEIATSASYAAVDLTKKRQDHAAMASEKSKQQGTIKIIDASSKEPESSKSAEQHVCISHTEIEELSKTDEETSPVAEQPK